MKIISYSLKEKREIRVALLLDEIAIDIESGLKKYAKKIGRSEKDSFTGSMSSVLNDWDHNKFLIENFTAIIKSEDLSSLTYENQSISYNLSHIQIHSPLPVPNSFRDFYAFEKHVKKARKLRSMEVAKEWYDFPAFYFSNNHVFYGHNESIQKPKYTNKLDFELEIACIIGKEGKNIKLSEAEDYIAGYSILNDWSARDIQRQEMQIGLGPAKGKDFATSMGPYMITPEEISEFKKNKGYDLKMIAWKNKKIISEGNWVEIHYSFEEMIVRASAEVTLYPGDVLGSGTVGTGCILELRPENTDGWLEIGDEVELEVEKLGILKNTIV
jgi:fumarylacetoacetate (FAA) hydrolase